jgi:hypothetical protein
MYPELPFQVEALRRVSHGLTEGHSIHLPIPGGALGKAPYSGGRPKGEGSRGSQQGFSVSTSEVRTLIGIVHGGSQEDGAW